MREKLFAAATELWSVAEGSSETEMANDILEEVCSCVNKGILTLRKSSYKKHNQAEGDTWISMTQEKDKKKARQFVSSNGLR